jgi:hypothetical protein
MNQQSSARSIFGHGSPATVLIAVLMILAVLSGIAGILVSPLIAILAAAAVVAASIVMWRQSAKHRGGRVALFVIEAVIGLSAVLGGAQLLRGDFLNDVPLSWLAGTPFSDYMIPGLVLAIVVGGSALLAAATLSIDREWALLPSVLAGPLLVGYLFVEAISIDSKAGNALLPVLAAQLLYFVLGVAVSGLAGFLWVGEYRLQRPDLRRVSHA